MIDNGRLFYRVIFDNAPLAVVARENGIPITAVVERVRQHSRDQETNEANLKRSLLIAVRSAMAHTDWQPPDELVQFLGGRRAIKTGYKATPVAPLESEYRGRDALQQARADWGH